MTTKLSTVGAVSPGSVRQLAVLEARRSLRRASIWIGFVLTIVIVSGNTTADWPGGSYTEKLPLSFMPILLGAFIAAFRTGRRDSRHDVSESAPLGADARALARLASVVLPVALTTITVVGLAIVSRIEGGFWMGEAPRRTDTALHPIGELIQPLLFVAFAGVIGLAIGRVRPSRAMPLAIVVGVFLALLAPAYWLLNVPPVHAMSPMQTQPMSIELDEGVDVNTLPIDWFVEADDDGDPPTRQLVHRPTILFHDLYLVGLAALGAGLGVRGTIGRRLVWSGACVAVVGVVMQLVVNPV